MNFISNGKVTEHKRDRALLEKQITLLRAEAHMKSLDNERLASECRIKVIIIIDILTKVIFIITNGRTNATSFTTVQGEQLARMTEMLNELRQSY